jgi:nucleoside-diphosphate-sugar epimerase
MLLSILVIASPPIFGEKLTTGDAATAHDRVLIVGATRGTGLETVKLLLEKGIPTVAFARPTSDLSQLEALSVEVISGDAMQQADLEAAIALGPWRAIVTTLSCFGCENPPDYVGNRNLFDAMKGSDSRRVILISTVGVGESAAATPWIVEWILKDPIALKAKAEAHLVDSGLDYTIIRPGGLTEAKPTGNGILTEDPSRMGMIARPDLAELIVAVIEDDATIGKIYTAIDKDKHWLWDMYGD